MKKIWITGCALVCFSFVQAQQLQGRIVYERTVQIRLRFTGMGEGMENMLPKTRTDRIEVLFGNNQSLRRQLEDERPSADNFGGNGMQIRMISAGADDISYYDFTEGRRVDQREFAAKKYLIADSISKLNWKLTGETSTVLGYTCQQATAQRIATRMNMTMENGTMKRVEVPDTLNIVAWFTTAIPVSAGPEYQGQLPGLIMGIDINNGQTVYKAAELSPKVDVASIKEPKRGKKVTNDEFNKEREKVLQDMEKNSGGRRVFRMGGG